MHGRIDSQLQDCLVEGQVPSVDGGRPNCTGDQGTGYGKFSRKLPLNAEAAHWDNSERAL